MTNFDDIKKSKFFEKADVIVYAFVLLLIVALFSVFIWSADEKTLTGISVSTTENGNAAVIFIYEFETDKITIASEWEERIVVTETDDELQIKFIFGDEYNLLTILKKEKIAVMTEATCSFHQDCTKFPPITDGSGVIICIPHGLTVYGIGGADYQPNVG